MPNIGNLCLILSGYKSYNGHIYQYRDAAPQFSLRVCMVWLTLVTAEVLRVRFPDSYCGILAVSDTAVTTDGFELAILNARSQIHCAIMMPTAVLLLH